jgi:hypothetical protein
VNRDYAFDVARDSEESSFRLGEHGNGDTRKEMAALSGAIWKPFVYAGFRVAFTRMQDLVAMDGFVVDSFQEDKDRTTATMAFRYAPPNGAAKKTILTGGTITLETENHWAIQSYDCKSVLTAEGKTFDETRQGRIRYRPFEGSVIPAFFDSRITRGALIKDEMYELEDVQKLANDAVLPVLLEDYGLAGPKGEPPRVWSGRLVILSIAAVVFLISSYIVVRWMRRQPSLV